MSKKHENHAHAVTRRGFLSGAGVASATLLTLDSPRAVHAAAPAGSIRGSVAAPAATQVARDSGTAPLPPLPARAVHRCGSDVQTQCLKELGIEFVAANPGSSFEGLQESIVNYGDPQGVMPEWITALHEETSVDMANGYGKAEGKPMVAMLHGTIGLQHASMSIYQAFYSGTPMVIIVGRDDGFIQAHTADDMAAMVRSYTKWDATPKTLAESIEAIQEAYRQAMTPPRAPTVVVIDMELQKEEAGDLKIPAYKPPQIPGIDPTTAREIAASLLTANNPRIEVGQLRTPEGIANAVRLAELTGASVSTRATQGPMSFPQRHPLTGPGADVKYDYRLGLEVGPADVGLVGPTVASLRGKRDLMNIGFGGLRDKAPPADRSPDTAMAIKRQIDIDAEASLPALIAEVQKQATAAQMRRIADRSKKHAKTNHDAFVANLTKALDVKRKGWNSSPVSTARIYAELWPLIENEDWCLASPSAFSSGHHRDLWVHDKPYSYLGTQGAGGMGYGAGACAGAALAARARNRIVINVQTDGDLNYAPGMLWSAAHHKLPLLTVMHNNRAWHQEMMFLQYMAGVRGRGTDRGHIGTTLRDPPIDYAKMAAAYGMAGEGPISDPSKLGDALARGVASAKRGEPYLIDVLTQPR